MLFRMLVDTGQIEPSLIKRRIDNQYYDLIVTTSHLDSPDRVSETFGLPIALADRAWERYAPIRVEGGVLYYGRRGDRGVSTARTDRRSEASGDRHLPAPRGRRMAACSAEEALGDLLDMPGSMPAAGAVSCGSASRSGGPGRLRAGRPRPELLPSSGCGPFQI